jgi:protein-glutamine gamma-glutamyltransferase
VLTSAQTAHLGLDRLRNLPREARDTLFLLLVIAWVLWPQVQHLPVWCSALTAIVLAWRGYLAWNNRSLPGRWWLIGLLALAVGATWFTHRTLIGREAGVTLIVVLLALKTLELRAKRDAFVVFFLGFFTMLTNFLSSQSLLTAAAMLTGLMGLLTALVNAHMPVGKPPLRASAVTAGRMVLLGAPIMAILFALFPRLAPLWGMPGDNLNARTGLSATMRVGAMASLALDESIALRVRFEGAAPPPWQLYFRGPVLTYFDGIEWRPASPYQARVGAARAGLQTSGTGYSYQVTLEPHQRPWLMLLEASPEPPELAGYDVGMTADLQWLSTQPVTELLRYKAQSFPEYRYGPTAAGAQPRYAIELPASYNPRTLQLASEMRSTPALAQADALTLSEAVLMRLRTGGYSYTLDPGVYGTHSADEFWFDRKEGFCEHIAAAYVVLMRALDVPARIVTGYQGGEQNALDGYWVVRQSDAHAWAEIWQAGVGWVRVDPTGAVAPNRVGALTRLVAQPGLMAAALGTMSPNLAAKLRDAWDAVNNGWNQWVLNYGKTSQLNLLKNLGFETPGWEDLGYLLSALLVLASSLGAAWTLWERRQHDPWLRLFAQARTQALATGVALPAQCPPREMARALTAQFGDAAAAPTAWLLRLEQLRYARASTAPASNLQSQSLPTLTRLRRELKTLDWPRPTP